MTFDIHESTTYPGRCYIFDTEDMTGHAVAQITRTDDGYEIRVHGHTLVYRDGNLLSWNPAATEKK